MNSFLNLVSDDYVNFQKCGDVVVSPKDNMIGMFCQFCCDIYTNMPEFLHHLQWMHNDVLPFTKAHDVYSMEELLCYAESQEDAYQEDDSSHSSDSGIPADSKETSCLNLGIRGSKNKKAKLDFEMDGQTKVEPMTSILQWQSQTNPSILESEDSNIKKEHRDVLAEVTAMLLEDENTSQPIELKIKDVTNDDVKDQERLQSAALRARVVAKMKPIRQKSTCDMKSYAIARSARKREQRHRLSAIKKRIMRSIQSEPSNPKRVPLIELNTERENQQTTKNIKLEKTPNLPTTDLQFSLIPSRNDISSSPKKSKAELALFQQEFMIKQNKDFKRRTSAIKIESSHSDNINKTINNFKLPKKISPVLINKVETLPKIDINLIVATKDKVEMKEAKQPDPCADKLKRSAPKESTSASASLESKDGISLNFDLSDSVVNFLQTDLESSKLDADSLLQLAEHSEELANDSYERLLHEVIESELNQQHSGGAAATVDEENKIKPNDVDKNKVRNDMNLLLTVGLPIVKNHNYEELNPVELADTLRAKAAKFSHMLRYQDAIWKPKRFTVPNIGLVLKDMEKLKEDTNREFKADLNVSEVIRIINLINAWHAQQIDLKYLKKIRLTPAMDHYLQLFAFLPKINRCLYYCEWCKESSNNKSRYEKHRLAHLSRFECPHCKRGFKKSGFLSNHVRVMHSQEL